LELRRHKLGSAVVVLLTAVEVVAAVLKQFLQRTRQVFVLQTTEEELNLA